MALTKQVNSKSNIKQYSNADLPVQPRQPAIARFAAESTLNQTVINLPFQVDTVNAADSFLLTVDGKVFTPGSSNSYTFTAIDSFGFSSTVTLTQALPAGLNIQGIKLGLKKETEFAQDARYTALYESQDQALQGFVRTADLMVATSTTGTPGSGLFYSSIVNRASIPDMRSDLKVRMGIERIMTQSVVLLQNEFGPNGEPVWSTPNDTVGQIRFVGGWSSGVSNNGLNIGCSTVAGNYIEITFYGTGLNGMFALSGSVFTATASVDGGAPSANLLPSSASTTINARNNSVNAVVNLASGLSLGVHTVTMTVTDASGFNFYGFEVINESSVLKVQAGSAYLAGKKSTSASEQSLAYNTTFESGTLNSRGGRVVTYLKADGSTAKAVQPVDAAQANLASANHQNEEVARVHHFREFGAGRADDFSATLASANAAFTLDDGTTTLTGSVISTAGGENGITLVTGGFVTITFVGTGLDIYQDMATGVTGTSDPISVSVDGASIGTLPIQTVANTKAYRKIVSGLPYGTHTVKLSRSLSSANTPRVTAFIVYQPKKPTIPSGAVELADYNVMATHSPVTVATTDFVSTGVLRKMGTRENVYVGTWTSPALAPTVFESGFNINTTTLNSYMEYTFYGTGIEWKTQVGAVAYNATISVKNIATNTVQNLSSYTTALRQTSSGLTFTASSGILNGTSAAGGFARLQISGLPLALYTIKVLQNQSGTGQFYGDAFDVITPIHSAKPNLTYDQQNTLLVGSCGISDNRKTSAIKEITTQVKNVSQAVAITVSPSTTSTTPIPMPDMSVTHSNKTGRIKVSYSATTRNSTLNTATLTQIYVDGVAVGNAKAFDQHVANLNGNQGDSFFVNVSPGVHKIDLYWSNNGGTSTASGTGRNLLVEEI